MRSKFTTVPNKDTTPAPGSTNLSDSVEGGTRQAIRTPTPAAKIVLNMQTARQSKLKPERCPSGRDRVHLKHAVAQQTKSTNAPRWLQGAGLPASWCRKGIILKFTEVKATIAPRETMETRLLNSKQDASASASVPATHVANTGVCVHEFTTLNLAGTRPSRAKHIQILA
eukprot:gnl/MRDRNA2_/MRDRNA2_216808_c0_seq1.p2 gnl/MRDRNA2_/MRDRNA2_216808_c0~~gnl/MRDRNA2_/MRDRNA2_216808_c0_seq1.p2  ORF type:complete len:170 (-),score=22.06 gnl/MRDRNA2_/MRDRNA2_216808_c0_seq1:346-855(-)